MTESASMPPVIPKGVPYAQIPWAIIEDHDIPHSAFRVYCYLMRRANDHNRAWPGQRRVAKDVGMSTATVAKAVKLLETGGWIGVRRERRGDGKHEVNRYEIYGHPVSVSKAPVADSATDGVADSATDQDTDRTTTSELVAAKPRNPYWDNLVDLFGEATKPQEGLYGAFVVFLRDGGYDPGEIPRRAALLAELWGPEKVTAASLWKHWSRFDGQIGQVTQNDVDAFTQRREREAMIERLAE